MEHDTRRAGVMHLAIHEPFLFWNYMWKKLKLPSVDFYWYKDHYCQNTGWHLFMQIWYFDGFRRNKIIKIW